MGTGEGACRAAGGGRRRCTSSAEHAFDCARRHEAGARISTPISRSSQSPSTNVSGSALRLALCTVFLLSPTPLSLSPLPLVSLISLVSLSRLSIARNPCHPLKRSTRRRRSPTPAPTRYALEASCGGALGQPNIRRRARSGQRKRKRSGARSSRGRFGSTSCTRCARTGGSRAARTVSSHT